MSLINCQECGKEISDKASSCPNCGCPIHKGTKYKIVINGYDDTDIAALAGLDEVFGITYEDGIKILNNLPYTISEYDSLNEASVYAKPLMSFQWGINISVLTPENTNVSPDSLINVMSNKVTCPTCKSTHVIRISASSKIANAIMFGVFGNRRKKTFHCSTCGYEW